MTVSAFNLADPSPWRGLRLTEADLQSLSRQGCVSAERPSSGSRRGTVFKLRWRLGRKQRVRYLGRDPGRANAVRIMLKAL